MVPPLRWGKETPLVGDYVGEARVDPRTKNLTKRLRAGEVAIIDHSDIDGVSAEALVACNPLVVVNAVKSTSGRYPNLGPGIFSTAGVPLADDCGPGVMEAGEGTRVCVMETGEVYAGEELAATGTVQTAETIAANQEDARADMNAQLRTFTTNTMEYIEREQDLIFDGAGVPDVKTFPEGRHVLVVVRGYRYKEDLAALRLYIREYRPIMTGVDGGTDAILEEGHKLDMVVDDMDSVPDKALICGAEIVVHAHRDGYAPGSKCVDELGVDHIVFPCTGASEDVAMLLADDRGVRLIVVLGTHSTLIELLDKGRPGMASTFLTRLVVGGKLIDAKGVSQLYRSHISNWRIFVLLLAGCTATGAAMVSTAMGQATFGLVSAWLGDILQWLGSFL